MILSILQAANAQAKLNSILMGRPLRSKKKIYKTNNNVLLTRPVIGPTSGPSGPVMLKFKITFPGGPGGPGGPSLPLGPGLPGVP